MSQPWEGRYDPGVYRLIPGSILVAASIGSLAAPAATKTGATSHKLGSIIIPAGVLIPGRSRIDVKGLVKRVGATATANLDVRLGTLKTTSDNLVSQVSLAATTNLERRLGEEIWVGSKTGFTATDTLLALTNTASISDDRTTNFDTTAEMELGVYISSANAADSFSLIALQAIIQS